MPVSPRYQPDPQFDRLGAEFAGFPGGHLAPMELPVPFAAGLRDVFGRL